MTNNCALTMAMESLETQKEICEQIMLEKVDRSSLAEFSICLLDEICEYNEDESLERMKTIDEALRVIHHLIQNN